MSDFFLMQIQAGTRKRVPLDELKRIFFETHPEALQLPGRNAFLLARLQSFAQEGAITLPAGGSWEKVGNPPLPLWVQVVRASVEPNMDYTSVPWVPELGFWPELKMPALEAARVINDFLLRRRTTLTMVPIKERSLEIFGDEKRLDALRSSADSTLFGGRLALSALGAFVVPSPLPYRPADAAGKPVLIVENHNSFWSFGEWNQTAKRYAAVVYGCGNALLSSGAALEQVLREVRGTGAEYLGDLDPTGIRIPLDFNRSRNGEGIKVTPSLGFYWWLLENGRRRERADNHVFKASGVEWLGMDLGGALEQLWSNGYWIPQESLGFEQLVQVAALRDI